MLAADVRRMSGILPIPGILIRREDLCSVHLSCFLLIKYLCYQIAGVPVGCKLHGDS
jgi:hypothetical protein